MQGRKRAESYKAVSRCTGASTGACAASSRVSASMAPCWEVPGHAAAGIWWILGGERPPFDVELTPTTSTDAISSWSKPRCIRHHAQPLAVPVSAIKTSGACRM